MMRREVDLIRDSLYSTYTRDNAVAEFFFSSFKKERIKKRTYKTRDLARADIFEYIEMFYNQTRRHSHISRCQPRGV